MKNTYSALAWYTFIAVIIVLALTTITAGVRGSLQMLQQPAPETQPAIQIMLGGTVRYLSPADTEQLLPQIQQALDTQQANSLAWVEPHIDAKIDPIFAEVYANIPAFTTWYYSLQGEYSRYASALVGNMQDYLTEQIESRIFTQAGLAAGLDDAIATLNQDTTTQLQSSAEHVNQALQTFVATQQLNTPATDSDAPATHLAVSGEVNLTNALADGFSISEHDIERQVISGLVATGVGAAVSKGLGTIVVQKVVAKVVGTKTFQMAAALLAKFSAKMALKGAGVAGAAATGTAICSVAGPAALACGAVAGLATWLIVDKAFIEFDEALNREQFEADIRQAIAEEHAALKQQLKQTYTQVITDQYAQVAAALQQNLQQQLKRDFIPAQSATTEVQ